MSLNDSVPNTTDYSVFIYDDGSTTLDDQVRLIKSIGYVFLLLPCAVFAFFTNLASVLVLVHSKLRNVVTFQYMLVNSLSDLILAIIYCLIVIPRCGLFCSISDTFFAQFYDLYFIAYGTNVLEFYSNLIELALTVDRLLSIMGYAKFHRLKPIYIFLGLFFFSAVTNLSLMFSFKMSSPVLVSWSEGNQTFTKLSYGTRQMSEFGSSSLGTILTSILSIFRGIVMLGLMTFVNVFMAIKLKNFVQKKKNLTRRTSMSKIRPSEIVTGGHFSSGPHRSGKSGRNNSAEWQTDKKFTQMVICMFFIYLIGNIPIAFAIIYTYIVDSPPVIFYQIFVLIANLLDVLSHGTYFFVYYRFNNLFKTTFKSYLDRILDIVR